MPDSPQLALELNQAFQRAFELAKTRRHEDVALEHLLLALLDDVHAAKVLRGCGVKLDALRTDLEAALGKVFEVVPAGETFQPHSTLGFVRVVERSLVHAFSSGKQTVQGGELLPAFLEEESSHARQLLEKHGVKRLALFHHDPGRDDYLDPRATELRRALDGPRCAAEHRVEHHRRGDQ